MAGNEKAALAGAASPDSNLASSNSTTLPLHEQRVVDRIGYVLQDLDAAAWSTLGLRALSEKLGALKAKADTERYRRIPPSEGGSGLLDLIGGAA